MTEPFTPGVVGAVVINFNGGSLLRECVASLRRAGVDEIVVVDNGSEDGSFVALADADAEVSLLPLGRNLGYGGAANRGARTLATEFVVICNLDLVVDEACVHRLVAVLADDPEIAVVGPTVWNPDGSRYPSARTIPSTIDAAGHALLGMFRPQNPWSVRYRGDGTDRSVAGDADWLSGACLAVRHLAFDSVGGFDEAYFMYVEDLDLCWRLRRAGWRIRYEPAAEITHIGGVSTRRHPYRMLLEHHRSTLRFAHRSAHGIGRVALPFTAALLGVRLVLAVGRQLRRGVHA